MQKKLIFLYLTMLFAAPINLAENPEEENGGKNTTTTKEMSKTEKFLAQASVVMMLTGLAYKTIGLQYPIGMLAGIALQKKFPEIAPNLSKVGENLAENSTNLIQDSQIFFATSLARFEEKRNQLSKEAEQWWIEEQEEIKARENSTGSKN